MNSKMMRARVKYRQQKGIILSFAAGQFFE
jgi:hypothetical protein